VVAFGFPLTGLLSTSGNVTTGVISATTGLRDNPDNFQISAPIQPGNSGGPLFDQYGHVIGIILSKLDAAKVAELTGDIPQNVNFGVKGSKAIPFVVRAGVNLAMGKDKQLLKTEAIASVARAVTVQLICVK
jgi:S1-C subfamily serine protease